MVRRQIHPGAGFSLVEALVVLAVMGVLAAMAMSSYTQMLEKNRLKEAVESLKSDLMFAKTESVKRSQNILVAWTSGTAGAWCYGLAADGSCVCTQADSTAADFCEVKRIAGAAYPVTSASTSGSSTIDFRRGTASAGGVTFTTSNYSARVVLSDSGRARICTPSGATGVGYPGC